MADRRIKGPTKVLIPETLSPYWASELAREVGGRERLKAKKVKRRPAESMAAAQKRKARAAARRRATPRVKTEQEQVIETLPIKLRKVAREIMADQAARAGVEHMMGRADEFTTKTTAMLAGIALEQPARVYFDDHLDKMWKDQPVPRSADEVIVGGGLHAAIYAAVRVANGFPPPVVLERNERVGGIFAVSSSPAFFLNSRNRPGPLSIPGEPGALNVLPGSMIQPSDIGGSEYQTNDTLGWVIRCALAMYAKVITSAAASYVNNSNLRLGRLTLDVDQRSCCTARRVVVATGLNNPFNTTGLSSDRVLNFESFMSRFNGMFPLRGLDRVAVLGGGDGAKTVIEALTGQGPAGRYSVAALDWPSLIDWYGCPAFSKEQWENCNRSRYLGIGRLLPREEGDDGRPRRVRPGGRAATYSTGYNCVLVDDVPYDCIIDCTGYLPGSTIPPPSGRETYKVLGGRNVARTGCNDKLFTVGPAAMIDPTAAEQRQLRGIAENTTSLFRYAARTAQLAAELPAPR